MSFKYQSLLPIELLEEETMPNKVIYEKRRAKPPAAWKLTSVSSTSSSTCLWISSVFKTKFFKHVLCYSVMAIFIGKASRTLGCLTLACTVCGNRKFYRGSYHRQ